MSSRIPGIDLPRRCQCWLTCMQALISDCWAQDASQRPSARDLVSKLAALEGEVQEMDAKNPRGVVPVKSGHGASGASGAGAKQGCGCVVS